VTRYDTFKGAEIVGGGLRLKLFTMIFIYPTFLFCVHIRFWVDILVQKLIYTPFFGKNVTFEILNNWEKTIENCTFCVKDSKNYYYWLKQLSTSVILELKTMNLPNY